MLGGIASRIIAELGAWLWMGFGFALMFVEIFSGRGIALSLALAAIFTGTIAIIGASGNLPAANLLVQFGVWVFASSAMIVWFRRSIKTV